MSGETVTARRRTDMIDMRSTAAWNTQEQPHSLDAERALLGAIMLNRSALEHALQLRLRREDFYLEKHQLLYSAMVEMDEQGLPIDMVTLNDALRAQGALTEIGGSAYLAELPLRVPTAVNAPHHARIVYERSLKRRAIQAAQQILADAYDVTSDAFQVLERAQSAVLELSDRDATADLLTLEKLSIASATEYQERYDRAQAGVPSGLTTGLTELDRRIGGLKRKKVYIVAGRPGMGKSALGATIAMNAALTGAAVGIFTLEMGAQDLYDRMVATRAGIDSLGLVNGRLSDPDWTKAFHAVMALAKVPVIIDQSGSHTLATLRARARRMVREYNVELLVIDYLQLMDGGIREESREREISKISRGLKQLAKELDVPVIALSQLNRAVESRGDKRPVLSDLRESGQIEADADLVLFVHRPEYYGIMIDENGLPTEGTAELIIAKQRSGPTGTVRVAYLKERTAFENLYQPF